MATMGGFFVGMPGTVSPDTLRETPALVAAWGPAPVPWNMGESVPGAVVGA